MRWWRVVISKLSGGGRQDGDELPELGGPRRRAEDRYPLRLELSAKCSSWPKFAELFTGDVSKSGLFIPTDETAEVGEGVALTLVLPDGSTFEAEGDVANVLDAAAAAERGVQPGLGVRIRQLDDDARARFDALIASARDAQPRPETSRPEPKAEDEPPARSEAPPEREAEAPTPSRQTPAASGSMPRLPATGPIIGLDLGTTYTSASAVIDKRVRILAGPDGSRSMPSVISFTNKTDYVVGKEARERVATDPSHTVVSPKRLLGRNYNDREVQTMVGRAPYRTFAGPDGTTVIEMRGAEYAIPQLCSYLFAEIKQWAEARLEAEVHRAVCTVPISFDDSRVEALRRAAQMARLDLIAVIDEPSSAALANRFDKHFGGRVGVYDFGGGTFDFSIVDVAGGDFQVLATSGDTWLGGDDFDQVLAEAAANQFWRQHKVDLRTQAVEWQRLLFACERSKRELSVKPSSVIEVPEVLRTADGMIDLKLTIDRDILGRASSAIIERTLDVCRQALDLASMKPSDLTCVYLSGGTTHVVAVRDAIGAFFGVPVRTGVPPEHAVCLGAAIHAAQLERSRATTLADRG
jgi:actin-like ATPase involved in cell morphogenesis